MKFDKHILYPQVRNWRRIALYVLLGGIIGGLYGAVHDQISYTVSPEYFTAFKFYQFHYADFGLPNRVFVGIIGFLATWWVGALAGWFLARIRFNSDNLSTARRDIWRGFLIVLYCAVLALFIGGIVGYIRVNYYPLTEFMGWENELSGDVLQRFAVVGIIHNTSYIGGVVGLITATVLLRLKMKRSE
ncbi:MAG: hypothetical protein JXR91_11405 [Deltaproteobacteria bacterium]|nr:hypothetical protein [Deltaproteobacteria bacterium]